MATAKNKTVTGIVISKDIKEQLETLARQDRRSLSNYISIILEDHIKQKNMEKQKSEEEKAAAANQ